PLKQSQRLWMICETVECYWERRIGGAFNNVSYFEKILAGTRREARKLIVGGDVVDERIVQSFPKLMGGGQDIGKDCGIHEYGVGDVGIEQSGEGERLHKDLVVSLVGLKGTVEAADTTIDRLLRDEVAVDGVTGNEHGNGIYANGLGLEERVQLRTDEV